MDNLTHSLVGLGAAKAGLERLSPGATSLCVLAANAPDADIVVLLFSDRWAFLQHHRGITHAIVGTISIAVLLPLLFYLGDRIVARLKSRAPLVKFRGLFVASVIVSLTHPLLDWTNNYGIRFLLPWSSRWFYGDFVFIVDPFIWLILGSGCFLLTTRTRGQRLIWLLLALFLTFLMVASPRAVNLPNPWLIRGLWLATLSLLIFLFVKRVGSRFGARIAIGSIVLAVVYWCLLLFAHFQALSRAREQATALTPTGESISRLAAMPTLANPFDWDCVFETDKATYRFRLNLGSSSSVTRTVRYQKPAGQLDQALKEVLADRRTQIFLGFARFPVAQLSEQDCTTQTFVQLADLRYTEPGTSRGSFSLDVPVDCADMLNFER
jgi:inner membrane protein